MTSDEIQRNLEQMLSVQRGLQESQLRTKESLDTLGEHLERTVAIADSNARSIEATTNVASETRRQLDRTQQQLQQLIEIIGSFAESTNARLDRLEENQ
jgi:methyl-accepting chemotaxis protein